MQRLAGFDAAFLALESATNHMHVASLLVVDPRSVDAGWSVATVRDLVSRRLPRLAPFRRRLVPVPFGIHHPLWTDVPDVDLDFHVRRAALSRPGGPEELAEVVADLMSRPLDRSRPLWEMHVIEGLQDDRVAVVIKAHHSALDGVAGAELLVELLSVEEGVPSDVEADEVGQTVPVPSEAELIGHAVAGLPGQERLVAALQRTVATVFGLRHRNAATEEVPPPSPFTAPRTSLNVRIGPWRRVALARMPLEDVRAVTAALGGTANDVVLALCSAGLSSYFAGRDETPGADLVALVPLSVRTAGDRPALGNRLSPMLVSLATGVEGAAERLQAISAGTAQARAQDRMVQRGLLAEWAELAVPAVAVPAARLGSRLLTAGALPPAFNVIVSNVPGPKTPLFLAGARVDELYPLGPVVDSVALNVTVMSYGAHVHVGVVADRDAVADVDDIVRGMEQELLQLKKAAEAAGRR